MENSTLMVADDTAAQQHSQRLTASIVARIAEQGGAISFRDYMQHCLYEPGLGYYMAGAHKLGKGGDFTTAPEISPLFGQSLANHIQAVFEQLSSPQIIEFGAGSGQLACDILDRLIALNAIPERYIIIEISPDLMQRQQARIQKRHPDLFQRVVWMTSLPATFDGVIIANEVCDAMPVHLLSFDTDLITERHIGYQHGAFCWRDKPITDATLAEHANTIAAGLQHYPYQTEMNLSAEQWLATLTVCLRQGAIFILDYGYTAKEYYQPERQQGTLRCYYQHQAHDDVFFLPGLQDMTAHVNFTRLADVAFTEGADVVGFHQQADFLIAGGITELASQWQSQLDTARWLAHSAALKQLLLPGGMGQQFKVLSLSKALKPLADLDYANRLYQL